MIREFVDSNDAEFDQKLEEWSKSPDKHLVLLAKRLLVEKEKSHNGDLLRFARDLCEYLYYKEWDAREAKDDAVPLEQTASDAAV